MAACIRLRLRLWKTRKCSFISRKDFQNYCREHPEVALKVLAVVGSRLRRLVGIIEDLSFTTVRQRLISLLLRLAQGGGTATKQGVRVELTTTHHDLAAELGTVRELVSRNLSRLQAEGLLEVDGRAIIVKDLSAAQARTDRVGVVRKPSRVNQVTLVTAFNSLPVHHVIVAGGRS